MNKYKLKSILVIFLFCVSSIFIATVVSQSLTFAADNNQKNDQEVTLIVGSHENAVKSGVLAFIGNLNSDVEINKQENAISSDTNEIIVIFSHGSEQGMMLNEELISWYDLSILILQSKAKYIILATCYGANINEFMKTNNKKVLGFSGIVDAITMGYLSALLVNAQYKHFDEVRDNAKLLSSRASLIQENPEEILPLYCTACIFTNNWFWFIPLYISLAFHLKLTEAECNIADVGFWAIGAILEVIGALAGPIGWVFSVLGAIVIEIEGVILVSEALHSFNGAWISIEAVTFPHLGIYLQARGPKGNIGLLVPITMFDPITVTQLSTVFMQVRHNWICW